MYVGDCLRAKYILRINKGKQTSTDFGLSFEELLRLTCMLFLYHHHIRTEGEMGGPEHHNTAKDLHHPITQETTAQQIISLHRTPQSEKHKHSTP